ncbi:glutathione S-transferase N-terminal domain-containing protein [Orrella sp. JC864]|uniref:glutathione S-transferase n=1 Tax=Orrella sp. JC864 TaxID=3120298 RepID=UPI0030089F1A
MQLYFAPTSPYSRKVLVCAHVLQAFEEIACMAVAASPIRYSGVVGAVNPLGKIPVAVPDCPDGPALFDSRVICEYLDARHGPRLYPPCGPARWQALTQQALGDGVLDAALLIRYEHTARPAGLQCRQWTQGQWQKIEAALHGIESQARQLRADDFSIGEISLACALGYLDFRYPEFDWRAAHPQSAAWYADFSRLPAMIATQPH